MKIDIEMIPTINSYEGGDSAVDLLKDVAEDVAEHNMENNATQGT